MSAGIPGLGLGGLFFVLSALLAPGLELVRTIQGRSSRTAWRRVGRQFAIAVAIVASVDLAVRGVLLAATLIGAAEAPPSTATVIPLVPIAITTGLLLAVLAASKLAQLIMRLGAWRRARGVSGRRCPHPCTCCPQAGV